MRMNANILVDQMVDSTAGNNPSPRGIVSIENSSKAADWEGVVRQLVSTLRFGVVQITVHESHVVQVERTEKVRFAQPAASKSNR